MTKTQKLNIYILISCKKNILLIFNQIYLKKFLEMNSLKTQLILYKTLSKELTKICRIVSLFLLNYLELNMKPKMK
jgi:hypothetical protein